MKIDVVIATPGNNLTVPYFTSFLNTILELDSMGISWAWSNSYNAHVGAARHNTIVKNLKDIDYNKIFWIDSDISWEPWQFLSLYKSDIPIISGVYPLLDQNFIGNKTVSFMINRGQRKENLENLGMIEVEDTGFGFLCIKKEVFNKFDENNISYFSSSNFFDKESQTYREMISEDSSWCIKANNLGYQIIVDTSIKVSHYKNMQIKF